MAWVDLVPTGKDSNMHVALYRYTWRRINDEFANCKLAAGISLLSRLRWRYIEITFIVAFVRLSESNS
jgi:hypothetical protein